MSLLNYESAMVWAIAIAPPTVTNVKVGYTNYSAYKVVHYFQAISALGSTKALGAIMKPIKTIFDWKKTLTTGFDPYHAGLKICPCCETALIYEREEQAFREGAEYEMFRAACNCLLCGWHIHYNVEASWDHSGMKETVNSCDVEVAVVKQFDINSPEIALRELQAYLKRNPLSFHNLSSPRLEELVADIYKEHGFRVAFKKSRPDEGKNIMVLYDEPQKLHAIVKCVVSQGSQLIEADMVDTLYGVAIEWKSKRAYLATTSSPTRFAKLRVLNYRAEGYILDFIEASELFKILEFSNTDLPPLMSLTEERLQEIVRNNHRFVQRIGSSSQW